MERLKKFDLEDETKEIIIKITLKLIIILSPNFSEVKPLINLPTVIPIKKSIAQLEATETSIPRAKTIYVLAHNPVVDSIEQ